MIAFHLKTQRGQPYGSERRCCEQCGVAIVGAHGLAWTDDPYRWYEPPQGYIRCTLERDLPKLSFAYGNLAASTNHKPSLAAFRKLARERGWSTAEFNTWAEGKEWR